MGPPAGLPLGDPYSEGPSDLDDIPGRYRKEIERFFRVYKDLEATRMETREFVDAAAAILYRSRSDTGGPRISRHTIASRS